MYFFGSLSDIDLLQIFVVDMASTDNSVSIIEKRFGSQVKLTRCNEDLGSCGGLNIGIQQALDTGCDYICCLGEAVTVEPHALKNMMRFMRGESKCGHGGRQNLSQAHAALHTTVRYLHRLQKFQSQYALCRLRG